MWIFANDAFLSIVAHRRKDMLLVRARREEDIINLFPDAGVRRTPDRDYEFRAVIKRKAVESAMTAELRRIDYTNFKNSIAEHDRHDACSEVWTIMHRWGRGLFRYKKAAPASIKPLTKTMDDLDYLYADEARAAEKWRTHEQVQPQPGAVEDWSGK